MSGMEVVFDSLISLAVLIVRFFCSVPIWAHTDRLCQYDADYSAYLREGSFQIIFVSRSSRSPGPPLPCAASYCNTEDSRSRESHNSAHYLYRYTLGYI